MVLPAPSVFPQQKTTPACLSATMPPHDYVSEVADWVVAFCCSILCIIVGAVIVLLVIALTFAIDSELNPDDPPDKQDDAGPSPGTFVSPSQIDPKDSPSPGSRPVDADNVAHDGDEGCLSPGRTHGFPVFVRHPHAEKDRSVDLQLGNKLDSKGSKDEASQKSVDHVTGKIRPENHACDSDTRSSSGSSVSSSQIDPKDSPSPGSRPVDAYNVAHDGDEGRLSPGRTPGFPVSVSHPQVEEERSVDLQLVNKLDSKGSKEGVLQKSVDLVTGKIHPENHAGDSGTHSSSGSSVSSSQIDSKDSSSPGSRPVYADNVAHDGDEGRLSPGRTPGFPVSVSHPQVEEERSVDLQLGNKLDSKGSKEEASQKSVDFVTGKIRPENHARDSDTRSSSGSSVSSSQIDPKDSPSPGSRPVYADNVAHDGDEGRLSPDRTPGFPVSVSHPHAEKDRSVDLQLGDKLDSKGSKEEASQKSVDCVTGKIRPENHARDSDSRSSSGSSVSPSQIDPKDSPSPGSRPVDADNVAHDGDEGRLSPGRTPVWTPGIPISVSHPQVEKERRADQRTEGVVLLSKAASERLPPTAYVAILFVLLSLWPLPLRLKRRRLPDVSSTRKATSTNQPSDDSVQECSGGVDQGPSHGLDVNSNEVSTGRTLAGNVHEESTVGHRHSGGIEQVLPEVVLVDSTPDNPGEKDGGLEVRILGNRRRERFVPGEPGQRTAPSRNIAWQVSIRHYNPGSAHS